MKLELNNKQKKYFNTEYSSIKILEKFKKIMDFEDISVYDVEHAEEQFAERFPKLSWSTVLKKIEKGLKKINKKYNLKLDNYVIISYKLDIKIPIEIRKDRYSDKIIAGVPTILNAKEHDINTMKEVEILVEKTKKQKGYGFVPLFESKQSDIFFRYSVENGKIYKSFIIVDVD